MRDEILFVVVVLYNPTTEQIIELSHLSKLYNLIVVDNSLNDSVPNEERADFIEYLALRNNVGIAKAQNLAIVKCLQHKASFILFLDQDSLIDNSFPSRLLQHLIDLRRQFPNVVAIGPSIIDVAKNEKYVTGHMVNIKDSFFRTDTLISSGMLVPISAFEDIGYFDEKLFIDYVDHEWCWRANSMGYICCMDMSISIKHKVGKKSIVILGIPFIISAPKRYYFQYRNSIWLLRRHYVPMSWKLKICVKNLIGLFLYPLCSTSPFVVMNNIVKGILSAFPSVK